MTEAWPLSPWVAEHRDRVGFSLHVFPIDTKEEPVRRMLDAGRLAEELGFDAFIFSDHPAWGPECWVHMAALAATTERIRLGTGVVCALYRHPVMTARLAADLDNLSNGRLILGLGCGWDAGEFANLGLPFPPVPERQAALEEAIAIIRGVWGDAPFSFAGRYFQTTDTRVAPPPRQRPGPPVVIAGGGEKVTLRQVAQYADACQLGTFGMIGGEATTAGIRQKLAVLRQHCETLGRPFESVLRTHFTGWLILAEDEALLAAKLKRLAPEGLDQRFSGRWDGFALATTVEQAITYYHELVAAGIQYFDIELLDASDVETIRLFAEQVIPEVRSA
ncbi:MAG TPA: LLM class flavin-dependent oxidoreductase [Thermomicrobiales bacterium]|nr:LLM class flavin-dependent oxidoreductase [Thermomicrobiales bacterium]